MTSSKQENNLESSAKDSYVNQDKFLEMFRPLLSEILNYSDIQRNLRDSLKNSSNYCVNSFYRTFI